MSDTPIITLNQVAVRLADQRVLDQINWRIHAGENWVVLGPNGAGKTTLANTLMGRTAVVAGRIYRHYQSTAAADQPSGAIGIVSPEQYHYLYAQEQKRAEMRSFSGRVHETTQAAEAMGLNQNDIERISAVSGLPQLSALAGKPMEALSTGEMRVMLIVRALVTRPRLLILDEPFNGLDAETRRNFIDILDRIHDGGTGLVLVTHHESDIPAFFSQALILDKGRVVYQGSKSGIPPGDWSGDNTEPAPNIPTEYPATRLAEPNTDLTGAPWLEPGDALIEMREVSVKYRNTTVLDRVSWTMRDRENWALIGPNGAGKTTLLKLITGENLQSYANEITLFGRRKGSGESIWQIRRRIGLVADDLQAHYQRALTAFDVVCSGFFDSVGLYHRPTDSHRETSLMWMEYLGIADLSGRSMTSLSFGQQRLVLIARAMVKKPRLLILDEPCNGLDTSHRRRVLDILDRIATGGGTSLLYVTHRRDELPNCVTHQLFLEGGRISSIHLFQTQSKNHEKP